MKIGSGFEAGENLPNSPRFELCAAYHLDVFKTFVIKSRILVSSCVHIDLLSPIWTKNTCVDCLVLVFETWRQGAVLETNL